MAGTSLGGSGAAANQLIRLNLGLCRYAVCYARFGRGLGWVGCWSLLSRIPCLPLNQPGGQYACIAQGAACSAKAAGEGGAEAGACGRLLLRRLLVLAATGPALSHRRLGCSGSSSSGGRSMLLFHSDLCCTALPRRSRLLSRLRLRQPAGDGRRCRGCRCARCAVGRGRRRCRLRARLPRGSTGSSGGGSSLAILRGRWLLVELFHDAHQVVSQPSQHGLAAGAVVGGIPAYEGQGWRGRWAGFATGQYMVAMYPHPCLWRCSAAGRRVARFASSASHALLGPSRWSDCSRTSHSKQ